ncbi:NAD(P)H-dependent glycerol-3-phosphate dehydrogenase [Caldisalinibacter kiritimatiensis]|uniref:Glycerol-3-phosphate dehydrogenase [NAD(P)+] n=1 Tax=Caldisalinibacter kiritimatiensis TaxID=1304284 RepID=R1AX85_9FIRM|nr:NAD(P)H-dependent glycerol-3-phosphate dehydrogenase [Caldisalinibacter kiritimatiensis]EOD01282.1 Glycerol-3-phosphate dehydrogenase [NAD/P+] [Caldisalinibacter kiritimatiensis]
MSYKISILGGGSWGTALAILLGKKGYNIDLWTRDKEQCEHMNTARENTKYLPGIVIPNNVNIVNDIEKAIYKNDIIVLAIPSHAVRSAVELIKNNVNEGQVIVNVAKGIETDSLHRISEIVSEVIPNSKYAVLSGPSHAEEVARDMPTTIVAASNDIETAKYVQDIFMTPKFRVYTNPDVIGVELGGSLKNVIALGAGISDGLGYGDNTKAALMNRGIIEIARLGEKMGANKMTFAGLSGIGDLIVTCTSKHSRNRRAGILIGKGMKVEEAIDSVGMVVEGIKTTEAAYKLSKKYDVKMPITEELYGVLYDGKDVKKSVINLMLRDKKHEMEDIINSGDDIQ